MKFEITNKRNIVCNTTFMHYPKVEVFLDQVMVNFGSGVVMNFDSVDEAMQILNSIIRKIKGKKK